MCSGKAQMANGKLQTMDTIVFDIETKNFFTDPGVGRDNFEALQISAVGVYSYLKNKYFCFEEDELVKAAEIFKGAERLVGFSINRYDIPVLQAHFLRMSETREVDLWQKERVDLLQEIEMAVGRRISLSRLSEANLGVPKSQSGAEAIELYKAGKIEELKKYCLEDVRITKELYDLYLKDGYFLIPNKETGEIKKVQLRKPEQAILF